MARKLSELIKKENVVFLESIEINETLFFVLKTTHKFVENNYTWWNNRVDVHSML